MRIPLTSLLIEGAEAQSETVSLVSCPGSVLAVKVGGDARHDGRDLPPEAVVCVGDGRSGSGIGVDDVGEEDRRFVIIALRDRQSIAFQTLRDRPFRCKPVYPYVPTTTPRTILPQTEQTRDASPPNRPCRLLGLGYRTT